MAATPYTVNIPFTFEIIEPKVSIHYGMLSVEFVMAFPKRIYKAVGYYVLAKDPTIRDIVHNELFDMCTREWQRMLYLEQTDTYIKPVSPYPVRNYISFHMNGSRRVHVEARIQTPLPPTPFTLQDIKAFVW